MARVYTGKTLLAEESKGKVFVPSESHATAHTLTAFITKPRHPVFIEIRTRLHNPKNLIVRLAEDHWSGKYYQRGRSTSIPAGTFVEYILIPGKRDPWLKKLDEPNVVTPYQYVQRQPFPDESAVIAMRGYSIVTTLALQRDYIATVDGIAARYPDNIIYAMSALSALHSYFYALVEGERIPLESAALTEDKYERIYSRFERGSTVHERRVAYTKCYSLLARVCGINSCGG